MDKLPVYDLVFDSQAMEGVYAISLVSDPATSYIAVQLSEEDKVVNWKLSSEAKRILVSPVLVPEQLIYRKNINGSPAYVKVTTDVIEQLQQNFSRQGYQNNATFEHDKKLTEGISFVESWIVYNSEVYKAKALGFDVPAGTWMMSCQLSQEMWDDYVKSGEVKGFSMEAYLMPQLTNNKFNNEMDKDLIKSMILEAINEIKLAEQVPVDAAVAEVKMKIDVAEGLYADSLDMGAIVYNSADDSLAANVTFDYEGNTYTTDDNGAISNIVPIEAAVNNPVDGNAPASVGIDPEIQSMLDEKDAKIAELEAEVLKLQADLVKANEANIQMSNEKPASAGLKDVPTELSKEDLSKMTPLEMHRYNKKRFE